jgi:stage III sporulation protein AA
MVCDELGGDDDVAALQAGLHAGVSFAATVHAGSMEEALARPVVRRLLQGFEVIVQLEGANRPCKIAEIRNNNVECGKRGSVCLIT